MVIVPKLAVALTVTWCPTAKRQMDQEEEECLALLQYTVNATLVYVCGPGTDIVHNRSMHTFQNSMHFHIKSIDCTALSVGLSTADVLLQQRCAKYRNEIEILIFKLH